MILPLMHILIISDDVDKWLKQIRKSIFPNCIEIIRYEEDDPFRCRIITPLFLIWITDNVNPNVTGYRYNTIVYDKFIDHEITYTLQGYCRDIYTNRAWLNFENPCGSNVKLNWYRKFILFLRKDFLKINNCLGELI